MYYYYVNMCTIKINETIVLMSQFNDLLRLKKCMHNFLNMDNDLFKQTKLEIKDKYKKRIIKYFFNDFKYHYWNEFANEDNVKLLQKKYKNFIPDKLIYDPNQKHFTTIKYEFIDWLMLNKSLNIIERYNENERLFIEKINGFNVKDKKLVKKELQNLIILITDNYNYLNENLNINHNHILKQIEDILQKYKYIAK